MVERKIVGAASIVLVLTSLAAFTQRGIENGATTDHRAIPIFEVDRSWPWPPKLPYRWRLGVTSWVAVDRRDHVWVLHRPRSVGSDPETGERNGPAAQNIDNAAPAVLEFDENGTFVQGWGGPSEGYDWPDCEHGLAVDDKDNVWITGMNPVDNRGTLNATNRSDDMLLKFTRTGRFVKQFGGRNRYPMVSGGNSDKTTVNQASDVYVHSRTNEVFVADGYGNRRVLVLDADTLAFKRMWGGFGRPPADPPASVPRPSGGWQNLESSVRHGLDGPPQFGTVHGIRVSNDGLVYVADRNNHRIQVFSADGRFLQQVLITPDGSSPMSAAGIGFSPDKEQRLMYVADYGNSHIVIVERKTLRVLSSFGNRGAEPGDFQGMHTLAADSKGRLYTVETRPGMRVQRFVPKDGR
jgi:DNA-binding beta-propeller fold protein YncE